MTTNLLQETLAAMDTLGLKEDDIEWVGSNDGRYAIYWDEFKEIAKDYEYDTYCYSEKITPVPEDLVVVFSNMGWLSRYWNDGHIGWSYHKFPRIIHDPTGMTEIQKITKLPHHKSRLSEKK